MSLILQFMGDVKKILVPLNLPKAPLKLKKISSGEILVWEPVRKKWLQLTPEEWVRCHVIYFLNTRHKIPMSLMQTEVSFNIKGKVQRVDILTYSDVTTPQILVECKAPTVKVDAKVADQICAYNYKIGAQFLMLTNGLDHIFYQFKQDAWQQVDKLLK